MKSMVVSKLKTLISDEVNKQLAENYQELLAKLVKVEVEHMEEDMSYAVGAAYYMIGGRLIFTPIIYRDGVVDSISYIGDVESDKLYGLTKKMYKKMTSVISMDFGEVMSKKNEERASVDGGIIGQLFATPRTYSPKTASDAPDAVIVAALDDDGFREKFTDLVGRDNMSDVFGDEVIGRARDLNTFTKMASVKAPAPMSRRRITSIADLASVPLEKRASAAMSIARNGFWQEGVLLEKVAVEKVPTFGEQILGSSGNSVLAKQPGAYNFITKDYKLEPGFIAQEGLTGKPMLFTAEGSIYVAADRWGDNRNDEEGYIALETTFFGSPSKSIKTTLDALSKKKKAMEKKDRTENGYGPISASSRTTLFVAPNQDEVYFFSTNASGTKIGDKTVYVITSYEQNSFEVVIDPSCKRMLKSDRRIICHPSMVAEHKEYVGSIYEEDVEGKLMKAHDLDRPIVKTASFDVKYSAGSYFLNSNPMPQRDFEQELIDMGFDRGHANDIVKVAEEGEGEDVALQEMSQTLKAILAEITENKHTTAKVLELMSQAQGQAEDDGAGQADESQEESAILELAGAIGGDGQQMIAQAKEQGVPLSEILSQLQAYVEQSQVQSQEGAQNPEQQAPAGQEAQGQMVDPQAEAAGQDMSGVGAIPQEGQQSSQEALSNEGFSASITPEMIAQLKEISDKDVFNAAIISYFVDANNAGDIIKNYIGEIDNGVVAMAKTMLFVDTQKSKMTHTIGEKQLTVFINRGKNILNRMTDFVIDATLIQ